MNDDNYLESAICDAFLAAAIGSGLAWWVMQWWFA
jgi:hypothetical protein